MATTVAVLKFFKRHLLQNRTLDGVKTLSEESEQHSYSELLKPLCSYIKDGHVQSEWTQT